MCLSSQPIPTLPASDWQSAVRRMVATEVGEFPIRVTRCPIGAIGQNLPKG